MDKLELNKLFNTITRYVFCLRKFDRVSNFSVQFFSMSLDNLLKFKVPLFLQKIIYKYIYKNVEQKMFEAASIENGYSDLANYFFKLFVITGTMS